jgi:hypothetical protein
MSKLTGIISVDENKLVLEVLELISHPNYEKGWTTHDVAVIKVSSHAAFQGNFVINDWDAPKFGRLIYYAAGKIDMDKKIYGRSTGEASYLEFNSYIFGFGPSRASEKGEGSASIASNDSGSPVIQKQTGRVIAVASKSTAIDTSLFDRSFDFGVGDFFSFHFIEPCFLVFHFHRDIFCFLSGSQFLGYRFHAHSAGHSNHVHFHPTCKGRE